MTRSQFLKGIWIFILRPVMVIYVVFIIGDFLSSALLEPGSERNLVLVVFSLAAFLLILGAIVDVFRSIVDRVYARLSESTKHRLKVISKFVFVLIAIVAASALIELWRRDALLAAVFLLILSVDLIRQLRANH